MDRFFETLKRFNTGMSTLSWIWVGVSVLVPSLVATLYALRDDLWRQYGLFGAAVVFLVAFLVVGVGMAGIGFFIVARRPPPPLEKKPKPPALPTHTLDLSELFKRVTASVTKTNEKDVKRAINRCISNIYDGLRSGHVKVWGHEARYYPPQTTPPFAMRVHIPATFWVENTIEELDRIGAGVVQDPGRTWVSITVPDPKRYKREKALCYWDLAFDPSDARKRWPLQNDWMGQ